ncbi:MAG: GNAT family N-acetyltransferase [Jatrophihabitantaceae bacterium]
MRFEIVGEAATRELRRSVLRPHLAPGDPLPGDDLPGGVHLAALDDGAVLCTCFVYPEPCPWQPDRPGAWRLRQMATLPEHRNRGLGSGVVERAVEVVRERGAELLWCEAREPAVAFYARHGFRPHGAVFTDEQHPIPHRRMWRELSGAAGSSQL